MSSEAERRRDAMPLGPPRVAFSMTRWLRQNLFSTWYNSLLTLVCLWVLYWAVTGLVQWAVLDAAFGTTPESCEGIEGACWSFIGDMWRVFLVGTYPSGERWRPAAALAIVVAMGLLAFIPALRTSRAYKLGWLAVAAAAFMLIRGGAGTPLESVDTSMWGGLMLTVMLTVVGIALSFPVGVLLALGRRAHSMPVIRALCVAYIELIRGVPLITILFMSSIMLPLFFPPGFTMNKLLRAQIGIIMFYACYNAEVVRGGLQAIPKGQEEAAMAVGLNTFQRMFLIVLPQALRIVIPAMVGNFIALLKDTSLVAIIGLFDLLGVARFATANPDWLGKISEAYVFVAVLYWAMCFSMSQYSKRLEQQLGVGER